MHRKLSPCSVLRKWLLRCFFCHKKSVWCPSGNYLMDAQWEVQLRQHPRLNHREQVEWVRIRTRKTHLQASSERAQVCLQAPEFNCPYRWQLVTVCEQRQHPLNCQPNTKNQFVCWSFVSCSWAAGQATWWTSSWGITSALWGQQALQARSVWLCCG